MRRFQSTRGICGIALLAVVFLLVPVPGAVPQRLAAADEIELSFDEEMQMEEFLRTLARLTNTQMIWNPQDKNIRGKKIIGGVKLKGNREQFFATARGLLTFYELVLIPIGPPGHEVMLVMDARATSSILKLKPEHVVLNDGNLAKYESADGLFITTTIAVEHMTDLRNARNALTRIVTGQNIGNVTEVPAMNAFVVTDFAPNVVAIYRLLKEMDKPSTASSTTGGKTLAVTLEHAVAGEVAEVLNAHFGAAVPQRGPRPQQTVMSPAAPRITADPRTNKVLLSGTDAQIRKVQEAITMIDVPVQAAPQSAHVIRLTHIQSGEAAVVLMELIHGSKGLWRSAGPGASPPTVVSHNETNALLISATQEDYARLRRLVDEMDTKVEGDGE